MGTKPRGPQGGYRPVFQHPLVPHAFTYRFEYNRPPSSCDGEPAPNRTLPAVPIPFIELGLPKGERTVLPAGASIGEVLAVDEPESGCEASVGDS